MHCSVSWISDFFKKSSPARATATPTASKPVVVMSTVYLVTGVNRGIGFGLAEHYLKVANSTVIAAVRNPAGAKELAAIMPAAGSKLIIVKIDSASETDPAAAVTELKSKGISHIDTVIANAGIAKYWGAGVSTPAESMLEHFKVNALGPLVLFQAVWPLLEKAKTPKFITIGTPVGSITEIENFPLPSMAYGSSKAALHFITRKLHFEHPTLTSYVLAPGWVKTEMGNGAAVAVGMTEAPVTMAQSVTGLVKSVDAANREIAGGIFASFDGNVHQW
jgi:norsolorinic acid ketoreductase